MRLDPLGRKTTIWPSGEKRVFRCLSRIHSAAGVRSAIWYTSRESEFNPSLEGDHARRSISAKADPKEAGGRRGRGLQRTESCDGRTRYPSLHCARQSEVWVIESVEEL